MRKTGDGQTAKMVEVVMEDPFWSLLERYYVMVNARAKERGWKPISRARLIGSILSYFFLAHHEKILEESARAQLTEVQRRLLTILYPGELDELAPYLRAALSDAGRDNPSEDVRVPGARRVRSPRTSAGTVRRAPSGTH